MNKCYVHCDFSKWFIDYLKNEFRLFVFCCWYLVFTSVDLLLFKIKIFDRLTCISTVMQRCQLSRSWRDPFGNLLPPCLSPAGSYNLQHFGNITARIEISLCLFRSKPPPPCVISCVIQIPKIITLCLPYRDRFSHFLPLAKKRVLMILTLEKETRQSLGAPRVACTSHN